MKEMERRAEEVLASVPPYVWDGESLPVPVEEIVSSCYGLLVRDVDDLTIAPGAPALDPEQTLSGLLLASTAEIWVNADEGKQWPGRRRFTIGHELGHWVMHRTRDGGSLFCRSNTVEPEEQDEEHEDAVPDIEQEASAFAAALLMPAGLMRREYERDRTFERLCRAFGTSQSAMGHRLHSVI